MNIARTTTTQVVLSVGEIIQALKFAYNDITIQSLPSTGSDVEVEVGGARNIVLTYRRKADIRSGS